MRSSLLIGVWLLCPLCLFAVACGDDTSGTGGSDGTDTSAAAGDGGSGPTTTGAGGIADDGTAAAIDACQAANDTSTAVSTELGCPLEIDPEYCSENAPTWVPCVSEWNAWFTCIDGAATVDACTCDGDSGMLCGFETACSDEGDALAACAE